MSLFNKVFSTRTLLQIICVLTAVVMMKVASSHYDFSWATALAAGYQNLRDLAGGLLRTFAGHGSQRSFLSPSPRQRSTRRSAGSGKIRTKLSALSCTARLQCELVNRPLARRLLDRQGWLGRHAWKRYSTIAQWKRSAASVPKWKAKMSCSGSPKRRY